VEEVMRARENIFMGIFGGGARILRSQWRNDDVIPVIQGCIDAGKVPAHYGELSEEGFIPTVWRDGQRVPARGTDLFHEYNLIRVDDVFRVMRGEELEKYLEDAVNVVADYQNATLGNKVDRKADASGDTKKTDVGNMLTVQAIASGVPMYFHLEFSDTLDDGQVGLICMGVRDFCNAQDMGGMVSKGLGRFDVDLKLTRHDNTTPLLSKTANGAYELAGEAATLMGAVKMD
jgi:CRISPR type IV-associated protein Csf2